MLVCDQFERAGLGTARPRKPKPEPDRKIWGWSFSFTKRNWAPHNTKGFYFKVEYIIGAPPEYMPGTIHDVIVDNAMGYSAEIDKYARSVVYTGT